MTERPVLETPRLRLRPYRLDDFEAYVAMWQEPAVYRFIGGVPFTREQSWTRFLRQVGMWELMGFGFFAIEDRATGQLAGECGFHEVRRAITPSIEGTMETGWALRTAYQGRRLADEALRAAIGWAVEHGTGDRLTAIIDVDHVVSLRVAAKLGFREFARAEYVGTPIILLERSRKEPIDAI